MKLVLLAGALAIVYLLTRSESFQDETVEFIEQKAQVSADRNESMIQMTQAKIRDTLKLCSYCIETNKIQMFKSSTGGVIKFKARYMFLVFSGYPYGLAVDVEFTNDKITAFSTQAAAMPDDSKLGSIIPFTDEVAHTFLPYDQLAQKPSPQTTSR